MSKVRPQKYPVSKTCPECGSEAYRKVKSEAELAFAPDRVCKECNTRYSPPMPAWARAVYAGIGFLFLAVGLGLGFTLLAEEPQRMKGLLLCFVVCPFACLAMLYKAFTSK